MTMPTPDQIKAGNDIAALIFDAGLAKAFGDTYPTHPTYQPLIDACLAGEIDSVTAIYEAMINQPNQGE
jgi:hypothetical protein